MKHKILIIINTALIFYLNLILCNSRLENIIDIFNLKHCLINEVGKMDNNMLIMNKQNTI